MEIDKNHFFLFLFMQCINTTEGTDISFQVYDCICWHERTAKHKKKPKNSQMRQVENCTE